MRCEHCGEEIAADTDACAACGRLYADVPCPGGSRGRAPGQCVICGRPVCGDDPDEGSAYRCESHRDVPVIEGWAQVYSTSTDLDAELVRDNLRSEGFEARILSQKDHFFAPVTMGDLAPVRVLVPAYAWAEARDLLDAHSDRSGEVRFACSSCGEPLEEGASTCASCGVPVP